MPDTSLFLCDMDELIETPARGFERHDMASRGGLFLVRKRQEVYGYINSCPHTGVNLEWQADDFLDISNQFIQCSVHGAQFRIEDGLCLRGPCLGASLKTVELHIENGKVYLARAK